ncbi:MAG: Sirohydrochlorin cobaltochelatase [Massilibacillus sp.]|nr:Sirohydrochlorin cobaltochelatase [Massilibacillus sp.]
MQTRLIFCSDIYIVKIVGGNWMRYVVCSILVVVVAISAIFITGNANAHKKAIVVVSFGTTFDDARTECIESVENKIKAAFPDYEVRRAFTSRIVIKRLDERGIYTDTLEVVLDKLKAEGYTDIVIQSTHLTPGEEYDKKIIAPVKEYEASFKSIKIGRPIFMNDGSDKTTDDFSVAMKALQTQLPALKEGQEVVFMGHGSPHQHNPAYQALQEKFDAAALPVTIGVVEETDHPNFEDVVARLAAKQSVKSIILMPLMLVAGDHANNDMAGNQDDSWKNSLESKGYQVDTYLHGLGENKAIQDVYVQHVKDAIAGKSVK